MDNSVEMVKGDAAVVEAGVEDEVETEGVSLVDNLVDSEIVDGSLIAIVLLTGRKFYFRSFHIVLLSILLKCLFQFVGT